MSLQPLVLGVERRPQVQRRREPLAHHLQLVRALLQPRRGHRRVRLADVASINNEKCSGIVKREGSRLRDPTSRLPLIQGEFTQPSAYLLDHSCRVAVVSSVINSLMHSKRATQHLLQGQRTLILNASLARV